MRERVRLRHAPGDSRGLRAPAEAALVITHPEKVLFPASGITKGDLCRYYESVASWMLPHICGRPVTLERYPAGIERKGFIQKDVAKGYPDWLERVAVERRARKPEGPVHYPVISDARGLLWLANLNTVTPHVWCSRLPDLERPDLCVFDLDPADEDEARLRAATLEVRDVLSELGLPSFVKSSGSKGFHVVIPVREPATFSETWRFAQGVGRWLVKRRPELFTQEFIKADRGGRILIDTGRNARGATLAAAYAVRAKPGAPVSAPCTWDEVASGTVSPRTFGMAAMPARLADVGDLWGNLHEAAASIAEAIAGLRAQLSEADWEEAAAATTRRPGSRKRAV
ncbi:MAG: ATP-dependent DNA ligase [Myxococcales bacterium]|nr:MAG: ATP-dependent DNA ligase [Myxococcales bacterium]